MNRWGLALSSLRFHRRAHLGVLLGTAVAAAVLVGALLVGDSVRATLREQTLARIGQIDVALVGGDRLFRAALADDLAPRLAGSAAAPVLQIGGVASTPDRAQRANGVVVNGVDGRFFSMSRSGHTQPRPVAAGSVLLNDRLARQLGAAAGDEIVIRVARPSALPRDMALAVNDELAVALRPTVAGVLADEDFGRFGLAAGQVPPYNAFVDLGWLQEQLELPGRANVVLVAGAVATAADAALGSAWTLDDADLEPFDEPDRGAVDLLSRRVFIDDPIVQAVGEGTGILTYFVNALRSGDRSTPYSMVTAAGMLAGEAPSPLVRMLPDDLGDDGAVINRWLADDLGIGVGDDLSLDYFVLGPGGRLDEVSAEFTVRAIVEIAGAAADPSLMPDFPGIAESDHCRDWEPGIPVDLDLIRDQDEAYWDEHRGTPKAFIGLEAGTRLWANRFGGLTAIRLDESRADDALARCRTELAPASVGLFFQDVRERALASSASATDFGGLFLGLSGFLMISAFLLIALLYAIGIEGRTVEIGTLLAIGLRPGTVLKLHLLEGGIVALAGSVLGAALGVAYTQAVLTGLQTIWRGAIGATTLELHAGATSIVIGAGCALFGALATITIVARRRTRLQAARLLRGSDAMAPLGAGPRTRSLIVAGVCTALALALVLMTGAERGTAAAGAFFAAGVLLVVAAVALSAAVLASIARGTQVHRSIIELGVSNSARRRGRSLGVVAMLACGVFLVTAVGANRLDAGANATERSSGTGGFAIFATASIPVPQDLNSPEGCAAFGLDHGIMGGASIVSMRVRPGDDASCLNLASPRQPRLVGVKPEALAQREAFSFGKTIEDTGESSPWHLLETTLTEANGTALVPAIGDAASLAWVMKKSVGDRLEYRDEHGRPFGVQIVGAVSGSILQGSLFISEAHFEALFPGRSGYGMFLVDAPADEAESIAEHMTRMMADVGFEAVPAPRRLAEFNAVQNTYLAIFQLLGGLGLLLGCAGLGATVLRNIIERRGELALLRALGLHDQTLRRLVLSEHALLLLLGVTGGTVAAFVAVLPALRAPDADPPVGMTVGLIGLVAGSGLAWIWTATAWGLRGRIITALRAE